MATIDRWNNICRLCSQEKNDMLLIFGSEGLQRKVAQKLRSCLPILVYKNDPLPKQICQFCAARLDDVYEFREFCLQVYRTMHTKLLTCKQTESTRTFLNAMKNSSDPCQAQICKRKSRELPPLISLQTLLPLDSSVASIDQINQDQNSCIETLPELPCEVEIKEMNADAILDAETAIYEAPNVKYESQIYNTNVPTITNTVPMFDIIEEKSFLTEYQLRNEEKQISILEQALTGNLIMNNRQKLQSRSRLTSEWWCAPCNNYYKTRDNLVKHMRLHCPRVYNCRKCSLSFESVEVLAKHEANRHLKVRLDIVENLKDCHQCERQFASWEMLRQHRLCDHLAELTDIRTNTRCSLCNRFFPTVKAYQKHVQLHQTNNSMPRTQSSTELAFAVSNTEEQPAELKNAEQYEKYVQYTKSLACPTCGKVCTQQSALSNHMRTHEPKKYKCDICGRFFGLYIRLIAHEMSEHNKHNKQPTISPITSAVEQEEALNAEREAREARTRSIMNRSYPEIAERNDVSANDEHAAKRNYNSLKNVAQCGICSQWFSDHSTMLMHLQTHSDNYSCKNFICLICKKSFKEQQQLFKHEMCHRRINNSLLYTCALCNQSFADKIIYKAHQKTHIEDKTYHCARCNKIFFKEVALLAHQCASGALFKKKVTTEPLQRTLPKGNRRKYKCPKCDASFLSLQSRNIHVKTHDIDDNTTQKHEIKIEADDEPMPKLRRETSVEYDISPIEPQIEINEQSVPPPLKRTLIKTSGGYRCGVCQSPFVSRELAVAHLRSAHPVMPYQCPYCKKRFTTQYTFTHHIKMEHPDEPEK